MGAGTPVKSLVATQRPTPPGFPVPGVVVLVLVVKVKNPTWATHIHTTGVNHIKPNVGNPSKAQGVVCISPLIYTLMDPWVLV